jgi:hypothetical protein
VKLPRMGLPSPAMVVALAALVASFTGGAYAGTTLTSAPPAPKSEAAVGAVKYKDLSPGLRRLITRKIKLNGLAVGLRRTVVSASRRPLTPGPPGPGGPAGPQGPPGAPGTPRSFVVRTGTPQTIPANGGTQQFQVSCQPGEVAISGGFAGGLGTVPVESGPSGTPANQWLLRIVNLGGNDSAVTPSVTCAA